MADDSYQRRRATETRAPEGTPRARTSIVLVEPQKPGNIGAVARGMLNFGVDNLVLVNPCPITEEARDRAVHAQRVLDEAIIVDSFEEAYDRFDYVAAFTARVSARDRSHARVPVGLRELRGITSRMGGEMALVFGREADGLTNEEVEAADVAAQIPTHPAYASMNLSHAVTVALYEMYADEEEHVPRTTPASHQEKEVMFRYFHVLCENVRMKPHKRDLTVQMFRRLVGRAGISRWDYHRFMGVISGSLKMMGKWPVRDLPELPPEVEQDEDESGP